MEKDIDIFYRLLYEEASDILIFRPHEYKFDGALTMEKGELLRDIVSAANAWRRTDTYILVGVEAVKGERSRILGIINHLDEEKIRKFVNDILQEPILFYYKDLTIERKKIGMIHIPVQQRPFYLREDFANLKKYVIYVRRGDIIREADTEEAARIKETRVEPDRSDMSFQVEFAHGGTQKILGDYLNLNTFSIETPPLDTLPDFKFSNDSKTTGDTCSFEIVERANPHFYREMAAHLQKIGSVGQIDFCITNTGLETAREVFLDINIEDPDREYFCLEEFEIPYRPDKTAAPSNVKHLFSFISDNIRVKWRPPFWIIQLQFNEIPSGKTVFSNTGLYIGAVTSLKLEMVGLLKARNLSPPLHVPLIIDIKIQKRKLDRDIISKS
jgi:hypothetical protein